MGAARTINLSEPLARKLDEAAAQSGRDKNWILRQALAEWLAEDQRRHEATLEALQQVREGRTISHEEMLDRARRLKERRRTERSNAAL